MEETGSPQPGINQRIGSPTLRDLMAVGFRHRRLMLLSFLVIFLGTLVATLLMPRQYETHMKILVKRERVDPVVSPESNTPALLSRDLTEEDVNSEVELLKGRDLLEKVVIACGLHTIQKEPFYGPWLEALAGKPDPAAAGQDMRIPRAVRSLEKKIKVEPLRKSKMIEVSYEGSDPQLAAKVLQTLASLYLEKHLAVNRPPGALDFFQQQTEQYRGNLAEAEKKLSGFGKEQNVVAPQIEKEIVLRKLSEFAASLKQTQASIQETEQRLRTLEAQAAVIPARQTTQVKTSDNPYLLQQMKSALLTLELRRTELLTKFDPSYRTVQEVEAQIAQTREALAAAEKNPWKEETTDQDATHEWVKSELAKARAELAGLEARETATTRTVDSYRQLSQQLNQKEILQQVLMRSAKTAEANYLLYVRKQEEARISDALDHKRIVNVAVAESATIPALPSKPRVLLNLMLGTLLACLTSLGLAFTADYLDPSFRTPDEVEAYLGIPVLASTLKK
jgi:uncharacterized protein involved in exopolysaccharide biosynthesis